MTRIIEPDAIVGKLAGADITAGQLVMIAMILEEAMATFVPTVADASKITATIRALVDGLPDLQPWHSDQMTEADFVEGLRALRDDVKNNPSGDIRACIAQGNRLYAEFVEESTSWQTRLWARLKRILFPFSK